MQIRPAQPSDAAAAAEVVGAAYAPWRARLAELPDVTGGIDSQIADGGAWVAEANEELLGIILTARDGDALHIVNLAVRPDAGGRGIGTGLVGQAVAAAEQAGLASVRLATHRDMPRNLSFYERLGWRVTERDGARISLERRLPSGPATG